MTNKRQRKTRNAAANNVLEQASSVLSDIQARRSSSQDQYYHFAMSIASQIRDMDKSKAVKANLILKIQQAICNAQEEHEPSSHCSSDNIILPDH